MEFKVLKKSKISKARIGILKTGHGEIETPSLVPVATQAVIKTLTAEDVKETKTQIVIANTFHLHLRPGEKVVEKSGGLHKFMSWQAPIMTDSGGFQVFSLGFGKDLKVGKVLKYFPQNQEAVVKKSDQPESVRITDSGVYFRSPIDSSKLFLGPRESVKIQENLGADIIFAFDECTPPLSTYEYIEQALERTHRWERISLDSRKSKQAMFGIVQGSRFKNLREISSKYINSLDFDGFGIGGDLGKTKRDMRNILNWTIPHLDEQKPRHLLGIGHLEDIPVIIKQGIDLFDCIVPTHYARRGIAFTSAGRLNFKRTVFLKDLKPIDRNCGCFVCQSYKRNYICHLFRAREITALHLITFHNLYYFNSFVEKIREDIKKGRL